MNSETTTTNPGASNSADFQPPTQNPQANGSNLQPSSPNEQSGDSTQGATYQSQLQPNGQPLTVRTGQSTEGSIPAPGTTNQDIFLIGAGVLVAIVLLVLFLRKARPQTVRPSSDAKKRVAAEIAEAQQRAETEVASSSTKPAKHTKKRRNKSKKR